MKKNQYKALFELAENGNKEWRYIGINEYHGDKGDDQISEWLLKSPISDCNDIPVHEGDKLLDLLSKMEYVVKYGFCKKHAFTGWYCESEEGYQTPLNNDSDSERNSYIEIIGNIYSN